MKLVIITVILLVNITANLAVKKCQSYLPKYGGVEVDYSSNKVTFPAYKQPSTKSIISTKYDSKGLDPFFNLCESFMNTVQKKSLPKFTDQNGKMIKMDTLISDIQKRTGKVYDFELPILICFIVGILFALLMPIVGCCFCCCRCCGKCGGEMIQSKENAESHFKCCIFTFLLFIVTIFMLCGVLMMFVTNNNLQAEMKGTGKTYDNALDEVWSLLGTVKNQFDMLVKNKTDCLFYELIEPDISDNGVRNQIGIPLQTLTGVVVLPALAAVKNATSSVTKMNNSLSQVASTLASLRASADKLSTELEKAKTDLQELKTNCSAVPSANSLCAQISTDGLKQEANFSTLPNVNSELSKIGNILNQNFSAAVDEGYAVFDKIPNTVVEKANSALTSIRKLAKDGREKMLNLTDSVAKNIDDIVNKKADYRKYKTDYIDKYVGKDQFRYYGYIGLAGIITLIVVLLSLGLACGACGYSRDNNPVQRSSGSHHGGNCIMASVGFMFLFCFFLFLFTALLFLVGEHLHILCRELKDGQIIDQYANGKLKLQSNGSSLNISDIIKNCRKDMGVYQAIDLNKVYNIDDKLNFTKLLNIDDQLNKIKVNLSDQSILNSKTEQSLLDLKNSSVDNINFTKFLDEIAKKIVLVDLNVLAANLTSIATSLRSTSNATESLAKSFDTVANDLRLIQNVTVQNMLTLTATLKTNVDAMKTLAKGMSVVADNILQQLKTADMYVRQNVSSQVLTLITNYANRVIGWPKQFVSHAMNELKTNFAKCKPISNVYDGLVNVYLCTGIIRNFNGFWLAMGWCLFFFPFAIIFGVKVAKYYRRMNVLSGFDSDPYPGYEQHAVKIPLQELKNHQRMHGRGDGGESNPRFDGQNAAPPPYSM